ncbi:MAG TPA: HAMP domain-containing sensor histidine kinase [Gemmatimonadaceae bacterium]|jgi:signal transduction histidine kinase|nr:HAMP domain-containing sensor histidine kinase [Gemmatimonadaceae bacterium]
MRPRTLAGRFLSIVVLGALLPLALVGLWLTRSAERSGIELLRGQLDHAADAIAATIEQRWTLREGELRLLASNTAAISVLRGDALAADERAYLQQTAMSLASSIPVFEYRDLGGGTRWRFERPRSTDSRSEVIVAQASVRAFDVELPVESDGKTIGTLRARVSVSSVLAPVIGQALIPGASLAIADTSGAALVNNGDSAGAPSPAVAPPVRIERVSRSVRGAPLRIIVAAPVAPYVQPFERAARSGLGVLMAVALIALLTSWFVTSRVTQSLEELSNAATAVAAGDLDRTVHEPEEHEVGRLARAFNHMTESLRRTLAELSKQRSLAAVGEFAASLSHEVRNSLTAVRVDLQHARRHLPEGEPGSQLVARALESVRRLDATVSGALRVARSGQVTKSRVDLNEVLHRAMRSAEPSFVERAALLEPLAAEPRIAVDGDAAALEQLFLNLLINAAQASPPGSHARIELDSSPKDATIRIVDAGRGVDDAVLATVGAPFQTTKENGTGLGLPIARRIALAHGGDLTLESGGGRGGGGGGTVAVVRLPLDASP